MCSTAPTWDEVMASNNAHNFRTDLAAGCYPVAMNAPAINANR